MKDKVNMKIYAHVLFLIVHDVIRVLIMDGLICQIMILLRGTN
jgi:hypothetical protein